MQLKQLHECGVLTKEEFESTAERLGFSVKNSQAAIIGDHGTIIGDVYINPSTQKKSDEILNRYLNQLI
jgi:hypothetical protein